MMKKPTTTFISLIYTMKSLNIQTQIHGIQKKRNVTSSFFQSILDCIPGATKPPTIIEDVGVVDSDLKMETKSCNLIDKLQETRDCMIETQKKQANFATLALKNNDLISSLEKAWLINSAQQSNQNFDHFVNNLKNINEGSEIPDFPTSSNDLLSKPPETSEKINLKLKVGSVELESNVPERLIKEVKNKVIAAAKHTTESGVKHAAAVGALTIASVETLSSASLTASPAVVGLAFGAASAIMSNPNIMAELDANTEVWPSFGDFGEPELSNLHLNNPQPITDLVERII
jgi:hypothetical protein